jgi:Domain of unknown function (DUF6378)
MAPHDPNPFGDHDPAPGTDNPTIGARDSWVIAQAHAREPITIAGVQYVAADTVAAQHKPDPDKDVLTEAFDLINGERREQYGDMHESFTRVALLWGAYMGHPINMLDVTNMMVLLKVSRAKNKYHRDSYVDICGYAAIAEKLRT